MSKSEQTAQLSRFQLWLLASRPKTLPAAIGPVAVGSAAAWCAGSFALLPALACLLGAMLLQIGVNLANDYFDNKNQIDSDERLGPVRVTQSGLLPPEMVKRAMIVTLGLAAVDFIYLGVVGGPVLVTIAVFSILAALAYSGGPFPLASNGLGELFVFIFFGLVAVGGTYYVQVHAYSSVLLVVATPPGLLISAIMVVNNLRDINTDAKAGKRTLAVMLGREGGVRLYRWLLGLSYLVLLLQVVWGGAGSALLIAFLTAGWAWRLAQRIGRESGRPLNNLLAATASLSLVFSLLQSLGMLGGMVGMM